MNCNEYHIIGMSPGNSYFKDEEILYLLKTTIDRFGKVAILIADIPAISTYIALGYPENRARRDKAIPKGNALKNRVRKIMAKLGYSEDIVRIIDWEHEVENNSEYQKSYQNVLELYKQNRAFHSAADTTTYLVLESSKKDFDDIELATGIAVHYLLSEFAFLEFAPSFLEATKVIYVYHKNWQVYEDYIAGKFDHVVRPNLGFLLL
ncbi:MAG TPA: tRNA-dependent cyclodipeptide synthase [Candidatus Andersenbacteria bacterium]|nr:tRNA-dependent cyclodipeptide synthase [Candidatus Andersenbacteria bacterium]